MPVLAEIAIHQKQEFLSSANPASNNLLIRLNLISEVRHRHSKRQRIIIPAMSRTLRRAKWTSQVVIRIRDIRPMLRIQRHLKKVRQRPAIAIAASRSASANSSRVNHMIASRPLRKRRRHRMSIHRFRRVHIPVRPATHRAIRTRRLHRGHIV